MSIPYKLESNDSITRILNNDGEPVFWGAQGEAWTDKSVAENIIRACNSHDELVNQLRLAVGILAYIGQSIDSQVPYKMLTGGKTMIESITEHVPAMLEALSKARGEA